MPDFGLYTATDIEPCMAIMRVAGDPEAVTAAVENGACVVCAAATADLSSPSRTAGAEPRPAAVREVTSPAGHVSAGEGLAGPAGPNDRPLPSAPDAGLRLGSGRSTEGGRS